MLACTQYAAAGDFDAAMQLMTSAIRVITRSYFL